MASETNDINNIYQEFVEIVKTCQLDHVLQIFTKDLHMQVNWFAYRDLERQDVYDIGEIRRIEANSLMGIINQLNVKYNYVPQWKQSRVQSNDTHTENNLASQELPNVLSASAPVSPVHHRKRKKRNKTQSTKRWTAKRKEHRRQKRKSLLNI